MQFPTIRRNLSDIGYHYSGVPKRENGFFERIGFWGVQKSAFLSLYTAMVRWGGEEDARENPCRAISFAERSSAHQARGGPSRHAGALQMSRGRCIDEWVFTESERSSQQCLLSSTERTTHWHPPRLLRSSGSCSDASGQPQPQRSDDGARHLSCPKIRSIPGPLRRSCLDPAPAPSFIRTKDSNQRDKPKGSISLCSNEDL